jgi:hypothetical protein
MVDRDEKYRCSIEYKHTMSMSHKSDKFKHVPCLSKFQPPTNA